MELLEIKNATRTFLGKIWNNKLLELLEQSRVLTTKKGAMGIMTYFGRLFGFYGTAKDKHLVGIIQTVFGDSVKTPDYSQYNNIYEMFDVLYQCDIGVFQPYEDRKFDRVTYTHIIVMASLKKTVYIIEPNGNLHELILPHANVKVTKTE